jgi:hypothetical protein
MPPVFTALLIVYMYPSSTVEGHILILPLSIVFKRQTTVFLKASYDMIEKTFT